MKKSHIVPICIYVSALGIFLVSCREQDDMLQRISSQDRTAESVYMTKDHRQRPVVVWTEREQDSILFFYAVSSDDGQSFNNRIQVPAPGQINTKAEGMPKVAFKQDGAVIAAYEKRAPTAENKYAGSVYYLQSNDGGKTWSGERFIHSDTIAGRSRSYFDIQTLPGGEIGAVWLDIKMNAHEGGRSVRFARTENGKGFTDETLIDSAACECCRIDLYCDTTGNVSIAYRGLMKGNMGQSIRDIMLVTSSGSGYEFSTPRRVSADNWMIEGCPHTGPSLCSNSSGLHAMWYTEGSGTGIYYAHTRIAGDHFTPKEQIAVSGRHPQICALNNKVAMVWDEASDNKGQPSHRIHCQLRTGIKSMKYFLSPVDVNAYLPVITTTPDKFIVGFLMEDVGGVGVYVTVCN